MAKQPDYDYLLKLETWSRREAALIVCGFDPQDFRGVPFSENKLPETLREAYKVYRIFRTVDFSEKYGKPRPYPLDFLVECREKDIAVPDALNAAIERRLEHMQMRRECRERAAQERQETREAKEPKANAGVRERKYLLKMIGALAQVYFVEKNRNSKLPYPKFIISDVVEDTLQFLEDNAMHSPGLGKSSLHKKITEGLVALTKDQP